MVSYYQLLILFLAGGLVGL
jgi:hypothetical protein